MIDCRPVPLPGEELRINGFVPQIQESEVEDTVWLDDFPVGTRFEVKTKHHTYIVEGRGNHKVLISGHPHYCPQPVAVELGFIRRGLPIEFRHPAFGVIRTSRVERICDC